MNEAAVLFGSLRYPRASEWPSSSSSPIAPIGANLSGLSDSEIQVTQATPLPIQRGSLDSFTEFCMRETTEHSAGPYYPKVSISTFHFEKPGVRLCSQLE